MPEHTSQSATPAELLPLWPEAPRLCPERELPRYRYVPGLHPHPVTNPQGHSFGEEAETEPLLPPERWRENAVYLFGIDLYHQGYLWESHEAWEGLWKQVGRGTSQALFLQGLIQNSAAQLKAHLGSARGCRTLGLHAFEHLKAVGDVVYMGMDVRRVLNEMRSHYGVLWEDAGEPAIRLQGRPPCLVPDEWEKI